MHALCQTRRHLRAGLLQLRFIEPSDCHPEVVCFRHRNIRNLRQPPPPWHRRFAMDFLDAPDTPQPCSRQSKIERWSDPQGQLCRDAKKVAVHHHARCFLPVLRITTEELVSLLCHSKPQCCAPAPIDDTAHVPRLHLPLSSFQSREPPRTDDAPSHRCS